METKMMNFEDIFVLRYISIFEVLSLSILIQYNNAQNQKYFNNQISKTPENYCKPF